MSTTAAGTTTAPSMQAYEVQVDAVERLGPTMFRLTFGGDVLAGFDPAGHLGPRDMRVKLLIPGRGRRLPDFADCGDGWYRQWLAMDQDERGSMRTYTIRRARPEAPRPQVDVDFVVHVDERGEQGPGSDFATRAVVGDRLTILGPYRPPGTPSRDDDVYGGIEFRPPPSAEGRPIELLLAGDETAAPAICSILETLPTGYAGHALIEVPTPGDAQPVSTSATGRGVTLRWLDRGYRPRGELLTTAITDLLAGTQVQVGRPEILTEVDVDAEILWETPQSVAADGGAGDAGNDAGGDFYAWLAGEAAMIRDLRRLLVRGHGVDRSQVAFMGYWRTGRSEG